MCIRDRVTRVRKMLRNDMAAYKARAEAVRHAEVYRGAFADVYKRQGYPRSISPQMMIMDMISVITGIS